MKENNNKAIDSFPNNHIKPYDGMAITSEVWAEAHEEHRQSRRAHDLVFHGSGIISGLEVVANDPTDQIVFISPGIAVDSAGNVIVLSERVAYDFGKASEGTLYLILGHGEREVGGVEKQMRHFKDEFVLAARSSIPKRPYVELARITLLKSGNKVKNPKDPVHPEAEELDLRFRKNINTGIDLKVEVGVCNLGGKEKEIIAGWDHLAKEIERATKYKAIIDSDVALAPDILKYDLVYLGCSEAFDVDKAGLAALNKYLKQEKFLIIEALSEEAVESCVGLLGKLKYKQGKIKKNSEILSSPFLFNAPPIGKQGNKISLDRNLIYSSAGYGLAWAGFFDAKDATRTDIRSAHEWGVNMFLYFMNY